MKLSNFIANLLLLSLVFFSANAFAQDPSQVNWPYSPDEYIDFSGTTPDYVNGVHVNKFDYMSSYSDENGNLKVTVAKKSIPFSTTTFNGGGMLTIYAGGQEIDIIGADGAIQTLVLPHPNPSIDEYFVFSVGSNNTYYFNPYRPIPPTVSSCKTGSYYSVINSNGNIVSINNPLNTNNWASNYDPFTEQAEGYRAMGAITATPYCQNDGGYYIFIMGENGRLAIFNLSFNGTISSMGEINLNILDLQVDFGINAYYTRHTITVSPQGNRIAISSTFPNGAEYPTTINIFDLDIYTLNISYNRTMQMPIQVGRSFSSKPISFTSSGRYLYYIQNSYNNYNGNYDEAGIWRVDLNTTSTQFEEVYRHYTQSHFGRTYMKGIVLGVNGDLHGVWTSDENTDCNSNTSSGPLWGSINLFSIKNPEMLNPAFQPFSSPLPCKLHFTNYATCFIGDDGRTPNFINAPAPNRPINPNFDILCPNGDCETLCGSDVTYSLSAFSGAYDYVWKVDGQVVANNVSHYTHNWGGAGTHQIEVTVTSSCSNDVVVKQKDVEVQSVSSFNIYPREICSIIKDSFVPLSGGYPLGGTYSGVGVTNNNFEPNTLPAGDYIITYTPPAGVTCTNVLTDTITLSEISTFEITNDRIEVGSTTPFDLSTHVSYPTGNVPYVSYHGNYVNNQGFFNPTGLPIGEYIVTCHIQYTMTDYFDAPSNTCFDIISDTIKIVPVGMGKVKAINSKENKIVELTASPNPFNTSTIIRFSSEIAEEKYTMLVRNSLGQEIKRFEGITKKGNNEIEINMLGYSSGLYYVEYISSDSREHIKIIIAR